MNIAKNAHNMSAVTLGRIMLYCADDDRVLELLRHRCTAAHSRPCTVSCPSVRLACLYDVLRHCICYFSAPFRSQPTCSECLLRQSSLSEEFTSEEFSPFGGVLSVRRSGVEQRSFVHVVPPLRALPSLLSDVTKKKH